jgi:hypothetical protein
MRDVPTCDHIIVVFDLFRQLRQILDLLKIHYEYNSCLPKIPLKRARISYMRYRQFVYIREPLVVIPAINHNAVLPMP